jgi:hypothetical protein
LFGGHWQAGLRVAGMAGRGDFLFVYRDTFSLDAQVSECMARVLSDAINGLAGLVIVLCGNSELSEMYRALAELFYCVASDEAICIPLHRIRASVLGRGASHQTMDVYL